jgi:hypothetical protein
MCLACVKGERTAKGISLECALSDNAHDMITVAKRRGGGVTAGREKYLSCGKGITHDKLFFLPSTVENTHGKALLCRAPETMRTAKFETHGEEGVSK